MKLAIDHGIIIMLLTVLEDRATLRSDPSAGTEVSGRGDAVCITLFSVSDSGILSITLLRKPQSVKPWGLGQSPSARSSDQIDEMLQLLNMDSVPRGQAPPDSIQFAVAVFFITQVLTPFRRCILAGKHGGGFQIRPGLNQMV